MISFHYSVGSVPIKECCYSTHTNTVGGGVNYFLFVYNQSINREKNGLHKLLLPGWMLLLTRREAVSLKEKICVIRLWSNSKCTEAVFCSFFF